MRTPRFIKTELLFTATTLLLSNSIALASRDAGHGKDYAPSTQKEKLPTEKFGTLKDGRNQKNAGIFLAYLASKPAQDIYAKYGQEHTLDIA
ncbi:hypothetical protein [Thiolapillus sp.]